MPNFSTINGHQPLPVATADTKKQASAPLAVASSGLAGGSVAEHLPLNIVDSGPCRNHLFNTTPPFYPAQFLPAVLAPLSAIVSMEGSVALGKAGAMIILPPAPSPATVPSSPLPESRHAKKHYLNIELNPQSCWTY